MPRQYWSQRRGRANPPVDLATAARLFASLVADFEARGYLQKSFGYECVDGGNTGVVGSDPEAYVYRRTRLDGLWPVEPSWPSWDEDALLTAVEFLYDHVDKPVDGSFHGYLNCGWHYRVFDAQEGRQEYREEVNAILQSLGEGFEVRPNGEVVRLAPSGLEELLDAPLPGSDDLQHLVGAAVAKYRRRTSTRDDQMDAVRDLANILEAVRPEAQKVLSGKDEDAIFGLLNNFSIRHQDSRQHGNYDPTVWVPWMFFFLLASLHACFGLMQRSGSGDDGTKSPGS
jgi:hypothetical protein